MARVQAGDADAFGALYDRHAMRAFRIARAICHDAGRAEDATQDGFLAIWNSRAKFNPENGSFKAWSTSIVIKRAIARSETEAMLASLSRLPAKQAEVISLAFFGELSHSEIAALLDLPSGTVKGRMRLGLEKLRKQIEALP